VLASSNDATERTTHRRWKQRFTVLQLYDKIWSTSNMLPPYLGKSKVRFFFKILPQIQLKHRIKCDKNISFHFELTATDCCVVFYCYLSTSREYGPRNPYAIGLWLLTTHSLRFHNRPTHTVLSKTKITIIQYSTARIHTYWPMWLQKFEIIMKYCIPVV